MKHALISGHIYRNEDGTVGIETFTRIDNDDTDIFDDVDYALLEQIEPNFESSESYFFIAIVESKIVAYPNWEGTEYEVDHDVTEIKSFNDLRKEEIEKLELDRNDWEDEYMSLKRRFDELDKSALETLELLSESCSEIKRLTEGHQSTESA